MIILVYFYRLLKKLHIFILKLLGRYYTIFLFKVNRISYHKDFISNGFPVINVSKGAIFNIGKKFKMNNGNHFNIIGRQQKCSFIVKGELLIGDNVGISSTTFVCHKKIYVGNNVRIGGNTVIYDTDFHSLDFMDRIKEVEDYSKVVKKEVIIQDNVFIGAHATILKGVTIGDNSIIGSGSIVTKSVPSNQIWAGNPAKFIRNL